MNRERAAELLPIITAFANGEDIQNRHINNNDFWRDAIDIELLFDIEYIEWRIKPKPREFWIDKTVIPKLLDGSCTQAYITSCSQSGDAFIHVIEVIK